MNPIPNTNDASVATSGEPVITSKFQIKAMMPKMNDDMPKPIMKYAPAFDAPFFASGIDAEPSMNDQPPITTNQIRNM